MEEDPEISPELQARARRTRRIIIVVALIGMLLPVLLAWLTGNLGGG